MKTEDPKTEIIAQFHAVKNYDELAALLQMIYRQTILGSDQHDDRRKKMKFEITTNLLTYYAFFAGDKSYSSFQIRKRGGGVREISAPKFKLKTIQQCLLEVFNHLYEPHKSAHGFVPGKSIATNAKQHVGRKFVYNIDLKDFFPSTPFGRIRKVLAIRPFNLSEEKQPIGQLIANLCCHNGCLPQGAPTSPILTNIVCRRMDSRLSELAKSRRAFYTRYADDLTFSANQNVFDEIFRQELIDILQKEGYQINEKKERLQDWKQRQVVTGLVVNKKRNVSRQYIKDVRYWLHVWDEFGRDAAQRDFAKHYESKKASVRYKGHVIPFERYLSGKWQFLKMIRGEHDPLVERLGAKMDELSKRTVPQEITNLEKMLGQVLDTWENKDIESAKRLFQNLQRDENE